MATFISHSCCQSNGVSDQQRKLSLEASLQSKSNLTCWPNVAVTSGETKPLKMANAVKPLLLLWGKTEGEKKAEPRNTRSSFLKVEVTDTVSFSARLPKSLQLIIKEKNRCLLINSGQKHFKCFHKTQSVVTLTTTIQ